MKKTFIILIVSLLFSGSGSAQFLGSTFSENFSFKETGLQAQNWSAAQDNRGIMYFGNTGGILEYDGVNWRQIYIENNYPVRVVCSDSKGRIYAGGPGTFGYLAPDEKGKLKYFSISSRLDSSVANLPNTWSIVSIKDEIYFQANNGIYKFAPYANPDSIFDVSDENLKKIQVFDPKEKITAMFACNNTCYFAAEGINKIENAQLVLLPYTEEKIKGKNVFSIIPYAHNKIIIALRTELLIYNLDAKKSEDAYTEFKTEADNFFMENRIYCAINLPDDKIAIGTTKDGLVIIDKTGKIHDKFSSDNVLNDNSIWDIFYKDNILWHALNIGISKVEIESPFRFWNKKNNIDGVVLKIIEYKNTLYLSTFGGIPYYELDSTNNISQNIQFNKVLNISQATWDFEIFSPPNNPEEKILLSASTSALYEIKNNEARIIEAGTNYVITTSKINPNIVFTGSTASISILERNNDSWNIQKINDLKGLTVSIEEDIHGNIWLGTYINGVYLIKKNDKNNFDFSSPDNYEIIHYDTLSNLPSLQPTRVYQINNELYFATYQGLYQFNEKEQKFYSSSYFGPIFGERGNNISDLLFEKNGDIWADGLNILKLQKDGTYFLDSIFSKRLPNMSISSMYQLNNNIILIGSAEGLFSYNKKADKRNFTDFNSYIRKVTINEDSVIFFGTNYSIQNDSIRIVTNEQPEQLIPTLKYEHNSFIIDYAAGFYEASEKIYYSYQLVGYEDKWSEWTQKTEKEYTNLHEGNYTFQIRAKNVYGTISTIATYKLKILPPYYRTWWAYSGYIILLILLILLIVKLALRRVVKAKIRLEGIVKERTAEIFQQKEEIQAQANNLEEANIELHQQKEEIQSQAEELIVTNQELEKLSIVASETDNAVLIFDENYDLEWTNESFTKIYGYTYEEFTEAKNINLLENSSVTDIKSILAQCISEKSSITYEAENSKKTGEGIWVQTTLTPIFEYDKLTKIIAIESDITEIKEANIEISLQHKFITSSIRYAKTIQQAILPIQEVINENLNNFIIYRPKDVVSGDFYWFTVVKDIPLLKKVEYLKFIAVVDCTGHGVPGAFMSMIANTLLNEIINKDQIYSPKDILTKLNLEIKQSLQQDITENHDGMDLCLCRIEEKQHKDTTLKNSNQTHSTLKNSNQIHYKITFSGAKRPLFYYKLQEKELVRQKGDRKSIGGIMQKYNKIVFTNKEIILQQNDLIYLTTDGYIDQNNKKRKRFGTKKFENILNKIANMELSEQKQILETELDNWQRNEKQRDDITVVGIKL